MLYPSELPGSDEERKGTKPSEIGQAGRSLAATQPVGPDQRLVLASIANGKAPRRPPPLLRLLPPRQAREPGQDRPSDGPPEYRCPIQSLP